MNEAEHFVQKIYKNVILFPVEEKVNERNPQNIKNDGKIQCFRFFDKNTKNEESQNYSNWICFGKRMSLSEVKRKYENNFDLENLVHKLEQKSCKFVCYTQTGDFLPLQDGDMTYEEYLEQLNIKRPKQEQNIWAEFINEECINDWLKLIRLVNSNYLKSIIDISISIMKDLNNNVNFEEVDKIYISDKNISAMQLIIILNIVFYFSTKGEEYKNYINGKQPMKRK